MTPTENVTAPSAPATGQHGQNGDRLAGLQQRFVTHWGEMATVWGIPRTMGEVHALLYISPDPLTTDEIMERLLISRGNASMSLRKLEDWGMIRRVHFPGDRRQYFRSLRDVWELCQTVIRERKRREFDPIVRSLRQFLAEAAENPDGNPGVALYRERLGDLLGLLETLDAACERILPGDPHELPRLLEVTVEGLE